MGTLDWSLRVRWTARGSLVEHNADSTIARRVACVAQGLGPWRFVPSLTSY